MPLQEPANDRDLYRSLDVISELCWEAHRAWEKIIGELPKLPWDELDAEYKKDIKASVMWLVEHPTASVSAQHDAWRARTNANDSGHFHQDNMVPFDELPFPQQIKARLWRHVIMAVIG